MTAAVMEDGSAAYNGAVKDYDITRLTFSGYEYLDSVRNARIWKSVKTKLSVVGGATLDIVKDIALSEIKKELGLG